MSVRSFLKGQFGVLLLAVLSTFGCVISVLNFLKSGVDRLLDSGSSGFAETFRSQPNPGGSSAFATVFIPFVAVVCWWSIISDWKDAKKRAPQGDKEESGEDNSSDGDKPPN